MERYQWLWLLAKRARIQFHLIDTEVVQEEQQDEPTAEVEETPGLPAPEPVRKSGLTPDPVPQMAEMAFLIGEWDVELSYKIGDDDWDESAATARFDWHLDGHAIREEWVGSVDGVLAEGITFRAFNPVAGKWFVVYADSINSKTFEFEGDFLIDRESSYAETGDFLSFASEPVSRGVISEITADAFVWTIWTGLGQNAVEAIIMSYTRREAGAENPEEGIRAAAEVVPAPAGASAFDFMVGSWDTIWKQESFNFQEEFGNYMGTAILGGNAYEEHYVGPKAGNLVELWALFRHDPATDGWQGVWWGTDRPFRLAFTRGGSCDGETCRIGGALWGGFTPDSFTLMGTRLEADGSRTVVNELIYTRME